jgi:hypothetical protein
MYLFRDKKVESPYWAIATKAKTRNGQKLSTYRKTPTEEVPRTGTRERRTIKDLTLMERNHIINGYNQDVIDICLRCNDMLKPVWRMVRDRLRNFQVLNHKGKIMDSHFLNILKTEGVNISVWDSPRLCNAFRIFGMNDILDYSMFLRLCILLRLREKEIEDLYINDVNNDDNNNDDNNDNYENNNDGKIEDERDRRSIYSS